MEDIVRIHSVSELHSHLGFGAPKHPLLTVIDLSQLEINQALIGQRIAINLYCITLKTVIGSPMRYGRGHFDFESGTLFAMEPGQVFAAEDSFQKGEMAGWAVYFHPDFLIGHPLLTVIHNYGFFSYEVNEALHLSESEMTSLNEITRNVRKELNQDIDDFSQDIQRGNIDLLLRYVDRYFNRQFITRKHINLRVLDKVNTALENYYTTAFQDTIGLPSVKLIAEQVCLSPKYMSDLLKKETGYSAKETIHNFILKLAKHRLLSSDDSVAEISYSLGFEYPQYFSRMFKSNTGMTPMEFRHAH